MTRPMARLVLTLCLLAALVAPAAAHAAGRQGTVSALAAQMRQAGAGSGAYVVDLQTGRKLYSNRGGTPRMPASVEKLYTSAAALIRMGPTARLATEALTETAPAGGVVKGDLYLRGSGDPNFDVVDSSKLAQQVAQAGITEVTGRVVGDESAFDSRRGVPSSGFALSSDVGGPLSALTFNRGRTGRSYPYWQNRPANFTATFFTKQLRHLGVDVRGGARRGRTDAEAVPVGAWRSAPLPDLLKQMNQPSDNFMAEMLLKVVGSRFGGAGSTEAGAAVATAELGKLGMSPRIVDGSGLSRSDRTSPADVVTLLTALKDDPAFTGSLAVAGRSGTIAGRMRGTAAQDRCRAKTGTLRDVSALAGYCTTTGGGQVAFAFLMNYINPWSARALQDRMAVALATYRP